MAPPSEPNHSANVQGELFGIKHGEPKAQESDSIFKGPPIFGVNRQGIGLTDDRVNKYKSINWGHSPKPKAEAPGNAAILAEEKVVPDEWRVFEERVEQLIHDTSSPSTNKTFPQPTEEEKIKDLEELIEARNEGTKALKKKIKYSNKIIKHQGRTIAAQDEQIKLMEEQLDTPDQEKKALEKLAATQERHIKLLEEVVWGS